MTIRLHNVSYMYPQTAAGVFDVDLQVGPGELLAVIGSSGSGKTTLLKLLAGFLAPNHGRIFIDEKDVTHLAPRKREIGLVFQSYALFQHMSAWRNVAYPLKIRRIPRKERHKQAFAALRRVNLQGFEERLPATLSGGQQQRVALARALVFKPKALLLDEPLSALDAALRTSMRDEIIRIQKEAGIATVHVTHDQEEALSIADRVAVVESGRIVQVDTPRNLYDSPLTRSVAAFVGQANLWDAIVEDANHIRCKLGRLQCAVSGFTRGAAVVALVRPERVLPSGLDSPGQINRFEGELVRDRFLGSMRRYDLQVGATAIQGETSFRGGINAVSIPPESIRLLAPV
jgi:putative spermidine/putrescine transport system ATP-binding protein